MATQHVPHWDLTGQETLQLQNCGLMIGMHINRWGQGRLLPSDVDDHYDGDEYWRWTTPTYVHCTELESHFYPFC